MGLYINPVSESKEDWLLRNGQLINQDAEIGEGNVLVCLVDNGIFTAAGICYNEREREAFSQPTDLRPKLWYRVPKASLFALHPEMEGSF